MDLVLYDLTIKIDVDALCASQAQYIQTSCKMHINKIPRLAMHRNVKEMGHGFTRNREGD